MLLPCCCHALAMLLSYSCHVIAMLLPCYCHALAMSSAMSRQAIAGQGHDKRCRALRGNTCVAMLLP
jgi:hypothetical protein